VAGFLPLLPVSCFLASAPTDENLEIPHDDRLRVVYMHMAAAVCYVLRVRWLLPCLIPQSSVELWGGNISTNQPLPLSLDAVHTRMWIAYTHCLDAR